MIRRSVEVVKAIHNIKEKRERDKERTCFSTIERGEKREICSAPNKLKRQVD